MTDWGILDRDYSVSVNVSANFYALHKIIHRVSHQIVNNLLDIRSVPRLNLFRIQKIVLKTSLLGTLDKCKTIWKQLNSLREVGDDAYLDFTDALYGSEGDLWLNAEKNYEGQTFTWPFALWASPGNRDPTPKQGVWFCYKTNVKMSFFPTVWDLSPTSTSWTGSTSSSFTSKSSCSTALSLFLITLVVSVFLKWFLYSSSICSYPPKRWQHLRFRAFLKAGICHHIHRKQSMMKITTTRTGSKMYSFQLTNFEPEIKKGLN